jgi:hypothetical protein
MFVLVQRDVDVWVSVLLGGVYMPVAMLVHQVAGDEQRVIG